jgi:hypothetical protein
MAICSVATFDYHGGVTGDFLSRRSIALEQIPDSWLGHGRTLDPASDMRLVGLNPTMFVEQDSAVIRASSREFACCEWFRFQLPTALSGLIAVGDELYIGRTFGAELGLSLTRNKKLVFAIGAILAVPLGHVTAYHSRAIRPYEAAPLQPSDDYFCEFIFGENKTCRIHDGQLLTRHGYTIYLKNTHLFSFPGNDAWALIACADLVSDWNLSEILNAFSHPGEIDVSAEFEEHREKMLREHNAHQDSTHAHIREVLQEYVRNRREQNSGPAQ